MCFRSFAVALVLAVGPLAAGCCHTLCHHHRDAATTSASPCCDPCAAPAAPVPAYNGAPPIANGLR